MSVTSSTVDDGSVVLDGAFGAGSQLRLVDSVVDTVGQFGVSLAAEFGTDSSVLLLRSTVIAASEAVVVADDFLLNASAIAVRGCRLEAALPNFHESSAIAFKVFRILSGGSFSVTDSRLVAGKGLALTRACSLGAAALLEVARNAMQGPADGG
ncbi:putative dispersed gene family protein 1 (DGF-1), partial [Trypanosoma conorhini]